MPQPPDMPFQYGQRPSTMDYGKLAGALASVPGLGEAAQAVNSIADQHEAHDREIEDYISQDKTENPASSGHLPTFVGDGAVVPGTTSTVHIPDGFWLVILNVAGDYNAIRGQFDNGVIFYDYWLASRPTGAIGKVAGSATITVQAGGVDVIIGADVDGTGSGNIAVVLTLLPLV